MPTNRQIRDLDRIFSRGIVAASHECRREIMDEGLHIAIRTNADDYAYVFQAYLYWLAEDLKKAEAALHFWETNCFPLPWNTYLCFGHVYRKLAQASRPKRWPPVPWCSPRVEWVEGFKRAREYHDKALDFYRMALSAYGMPQIQMVANHGLGRLGDTGLAIDFWDATYGKEHSISQRERLRESLALKAINRARMWHERAIAISKQKEIPYAPPHNRLGQLCLDEETWLRDKKRRADLLRKAIRHFSSARIVTAGKPYAPPRYNEAIAGHKLGRLLRTPKYLKGVQRALHKAVEDAPHDQLIHEALAQFGDADRARLQKAGRDVLQTILGVPANAKDSALREYFLAERRQSSQEPRNSLLVLRRWSSYSPTMVVPQRLTFGGGYLLDWRGTRIVVDPGHGFLRNLSQCGLNIIDLDAVIVTHGHLDHWADLPPLLGLIYERESYADELTPAQKAGLSTALRNTARMKSLKLVLPNNVQTRLAKLVRECWDKRKGFFDICSGRPIVFGRGKIQMSAVANSDHRDLDKQQSSWLRFSLNCTDGETREIAFTSDTVYKPQLSAFVAASDVVVAHVSTVTDLFRKRLKKKVVLTPSETSKMRKACPGFDGFYNKHLGFWGTVKLAADLYAANPKKVRLIVLNEFGEEMAHQRLPIALEIKRQAMILAGGGKPPEDWGIEIIPSDVGTRVALDNSAPKVLCQFGGMACRRYVDIRNPLDRSLNNFGPSFAHHPLSDVTLEYLCESHKAFVEHVVNAVRV